MSIITYLRKHKKLTKFLSLVAIVLGIVFLFLSDKSSDIDRNINAALAKVQLINVADYYKNSAKISTTGQVESLDQAEIRSQISANMINIYVGIGDQVLPGQTLATFDNEDMAAQLKQAQAGLEAQLAILEETKLGARPEEIVIKELQLDNANKSLTDLYIKAVNTLSSAYIQSDGAIRSNLTGIFDGSKTSSYDLSFVTCSGQARINATWLRQVSDSRLEDWQNEIANLTFGSTEEEIDLNINSAHKHLKIFSDLLVNTNDTLIVSCALNNSDLDGYRLAVNSSRSIINAVTAGLNGLQQQIASQRINIESIEEGLVLLKSGATDQQVTAQQAQVKIAQANVDLAKARYNKTVINSPIAGYVSVVSAKKGELISPGQLIVSVVNISVLKIKAYIDASEVIHVYPEDQVVIEGGINGFVMRLSPSIDPATKKVELEIVVDDPEFSNLVVGQYVNLDILTTNGSDNSSIYILPLQAIRLTSEATLVYGVDENDQIIEYEVVLGEIIGESIEVLEGISSDMKIVSSVSGLENGEQVSIK